MNTDSKNIFCPTNILYMIIHRLVEPLYTATMGEMGILRNAMEMEEACKHNGCLQHSAASALQQLPYHAMTHNGSTETEVATVWKCQPLAKAFHPLHDDRKALKIH